MKTHIIRLESHDDANSIRDKMSWSRAGRILLAFPRRRPPRLSRLDLVLLQRAASQSGAQLGLVTRNKDILDLAAMAAMPVFPSIPAAQRLPWRSSAQRKKFIQPTESTPLPVLLEMRSEKKPFKRWQNSGLVRAASFVLGVTSFFAIILLFLPSAQIELSPVRATQAMTIPLWASPDIPGVLPSGAIPARVLKVVVEENASIRASQAISIADEFARGTVLVTNLTEQPLRLLAGTTFRSVIDGEQQFEALEGLLLAGGVGEQAEINVRARLPGSQGNVPAGAVQAVDGLIGLSINVTNPAPMTGGTDRIGRAGSDADYERLYQQVYDRLRQKALQEFSLLAGNGGILIVESLEISDVLLDERDPEIGTPTDFINLRMQVEYSALVVAEEDVRTAAQMALDPNLPPGMEAEPASLIVETRSEPVIDSDGMVSWEIQASRRIKPRYDGALIANLVKGQEKQSAQEALAAELNLQERPVVRTWPEWWSRMPFLPLRIEVVAK